MKAVVFDTTGIVVRGDPLHEVWWQGRQWAVTSYGLECRDGRYAIEAKRLGDEWSDRPGVPSWPRHMLGKAWVDVADFVTAFVVALALHGKGRRFKSVTMRRVLEWSVEHAAYASAYADAMRSVRVARGASPDGLTTVPEMDADHKEAVRLVGNGPRYPTDAAASRRDITA